MNSHQLLLFDHCGICLRLEAFDAPGHHACSVALDRWWNDEYIEQLIELQKGQAQ